MHAIDAVVLAGGRGTRLHPHTAAVPKSLLRLGGEPLLEIQLRQLAAAGGRRVHLALGHFAEAVQAYVMQRPPTPDLEIRLSREERPLGTVGPVRLIAGLSDPFLLVNGDVLTTLPFAKLVAHHRRCGAIATVAVTRRDLPTGYGVVELAPDGRVVGHREKPRLALDVVMGVYVVQRRALDHLPPAPAVDAPELLRACLAAGETVAAYPSDAYWRDIGSAEEYAAAERDVRAAPERFHLAPAPASAAS